MVWKSLEIRLITTKVKAEEPNWMGSGREGIIKGNLGSKNLITRCYGSFIVDKVHW